MNKENDPRAEQMGRALRALVIETVNRIDELHRETIFRSKIIHNIYCDTSHCEPEFTHTFSLLVGQEMDMRSTISEIKKDPLKAGIGLDKIDFERMFVEMLTAQPKEEEEDYPRGLYL